MAISLKEIFSLESSGANNAASAASGFVTGSLNLTEYSENTLYEKGQYIFRKNELTGEVDIYTCIEKTTGVFDSTKWKKTGLLESINDAKAEIAAESRERSSFESHSGFLNKIGLIKASKTEPNTMYFENDEYLHIAGNVIKIPEQTKIIFTEPSEYGNREDLAILECWQVEKQKGDNIYRDGNVDSEVERVVVSSEVVSEWRIRTIPNASFDNGREFKLNLREGLGRYHDIVANGPKTVADDGDVGFISRYWNTFERQSSTHTGKSSILPFDRGVYVAGDGSNESKASLGTFDGYVYAVPLIRVERLNTHPFSSSNLNGAPISEVNLENRKANMLVENDIVEDFRHVISLSGTDYNFIRSKAFDSFMRSESFRKERSIGQYGLKPARYDAVPEVFPVVVRNKKGEIKSLQNLVGSSYLIKNTNLKNLRDIPVYLPRGQFVMGVKIKRAAPDVTVDVNIRFGEADYGIFKQASKKINISKDGWNIFKFDSLRYYNGHIFGCDLRFYVLFSDSQRSNPSSVEIEDLFIYALSDSEYTALTETTMDPDVFFDTYPLTYSNFNVIENYFTGEIDFNTEVDTYGYKVTSTTNQSTAYMIPYERRGVFNYQYGQVRYSFKTGNGVNKFKVTFHNADGGFLSQENIVGNNLESITIPNETKFLSFTYSNESQNPEFGLYELRENVETFDTIVPTGRWFVPEYFYNFKREVMGREWNTDIDRRVYTETQFSQNVTINIDKYGSSNRAYVTAEQATPGTWTKGDTITIRLFKGIISGISDTDTALARIMKHYPTGSTSMVLDSVEKLSVNDSIVFTNRLTGGSWSGYPTTITGIDPINNIISIADPLPGAITSSHHIVENTSSSSIPRVVGGDNIDGIWSGIGTNKATYTVNTNTDPLTATHGYTEIQFGINFPTGGGMMDLIDESLQIEVNNIIHEKKTDTDSVILNINTKPAYYDATDKAVQAFQIESDTYANALTNSSKTNLDAVNAYIDGLKVHSETVTNGNKVFQFFLFNYKDFAYKFMKDSGTQLASMVTAIEVTIDAQGSGPNGNDLKVHMGLFNSATELSDLTLNLTETYTTGPDSIFKQRKNVTLDTAKDTLVICLESDTTNGVVKSVIDTDFINLKLLGSTELGFIPKEPRLYKKWDLDLFEDGEQLLPPFWSKLWVKDDLADYQPYTIRANLSTKTTTGYTKIATLDKYFYLDYPTTLTLNIEGNRSSTIAIEFEQLNEQGAATKQMFKIDELVAAGEFQKEINLVAGPLKINIYGKDGQDVTKNALANPMLTKGSGLRHFSQFREVRASSSLINKVYYGGIINPTPNVDNATKIYGLFDRNSSISVGLEEQPEFKTTEIQNDYLYFEEKLAKGIGDVTTSDTKQVEGFAKISLKHLGMSRVTLLKVMESLDLYMYVSTAGTRTADDYLDGKYQIKIMKHENNSHTWDDFGADNTSANVKKSNISTNLDKYIDEDLNLYLKFSISRSTLINPPNVTIEYLGLQIRGVDVTVNFKSSVSDCPGNIVKLVPETKRLELVNSKEVNEEIDVVEIVYNHKPTKTVDLKSNLEIGILSESEGFLVSDLGTCVGDKQGEHHYMNPLYRLNLDSELTLGEFGFGTIPFAADSKGINVGTNVVIDLKKVNKGFTKQYGLGVIKNPMVGVASYLVNFYGELRLALVRQLSTTGELDVTGIDPLYIFPIEGRPLIKESIDRQRAVSLTPTAWKTPTSEIQGYVNDQGEVIATYQ